MTKNAKTTVKLDPRKYRWTRRHNASNPFAGMVGTTNLPVAVGEALFDEDLFEYMDHSTNGASFSYHGTGRVSEYAAVHLDNGNILFCLTSGYAFDGTNNPSDDLSMMYFDVTPL